MTRPSVQPGTAVQVLSTNHTTGVTLSPQRQAEPRQWSVYLHERGKKPRPVDVQVPDKFPGTIEIEGKTYHWVGADVSRRTLTYTNIKGGVQ